MGRIPHTKGNGRTDPVLWEKKREAGMRPFVTLVQFDGIEQHNRLPSVEQLTDIPGCNLEFTFVRVLRPPQGQVLGKNPVWYLRSRPRPFAASSTCLAERQKNDYARWALISYDTSTARSNHHQFKRKLLQPRFFRKSVTHIAVDPDCGRQLIMGVEGGGPCHWPALSRRFILEHFTLNSEMSHPSLPTYTLIFILI